MDFTCSPRQEGIGPFHLPSSTHSYGVDSFPTIKQIRRSLSHSPSKPARFHLLNTTPASSCVIDASSQASAPGAMMTSAKDSGSNMDDAISPSIPQGPFSHLGSQSVGPKKARFPLRRKAPLRPSSRTRAGNSSTRSVLGDCSNVANVGTAPVDYTNAEQSLEERSNSISMPVSTAKRAQNARDDEPMSSFMGRTKLENLPPAVRAPFDAPAKSSPLKRSDGIMNLDQASLGSPVAKRRSLHSTTFGPDFDVFEHGEVLGQDQDLSNTDRDIEGVQLAGESPASPSLRRTSQVSMQRSLSLRKSTLHQHRRAVSPRSTSRANASSTAAAGSRSRSHSSSSTSYPEPVGIRAMESSSAPAFPGSHQRRSIHLDSLGSGPVSSPFGNRDAPTQSHDPPFQRQGRPPATPSRPVSLALPVSSSPRADFDLQSVLQLNRRNHQPHPLSHALSTTSSASSMVDDSPTHEQPPHVLPHAAIQNLRQPNPFARSLPLGVARIAVHNDRKGEERSTAGDECATPEAYRMAKPHPNAFMSTGLISKKNRRADLPPNGLSGGYVMPDTPSKRVSFPPCLATPSQAHDMSKSLRQLDDVSSPSPFAKESPGFSGSPVPRSSIFAHPFRRSTLPRRESFTTIVDPEEWANSALPVDSQSSNDELPPTPTKPSTGNGKTQSKEGSLRSSLLGRRTPLGLDTFVAPAADDEASTEHTSPSSTSRASRRSSPHTPSEKFAPPDPSRLSISGKGGGNLFRNSMGSSGGAFPPATPTGNRNQPFSWGNMGSSIAPTINLRPDDVDTSLSSRFEGVALFGTGEFSKVYRVERPSGVSSTPPGQTVSVSAAWAVKKSKRPYTGSWDRQRKLREVEILKRLRHQDNIIQFTDSWEAKGHFYIQTEFCENGNLKDFLTSAGYKARLDDFRIWKILLELSSGVKSIHDSGFIHLDLKPANVFIDWEGVLKIGDFGLASLWPAPSDIDGEGDREYIGPEILSGRFDKPADIFALGMIMLEIAGNLVLPDNGDSWQRLRSGNFSDVPSLTWSSDSTLARDESGEPIVDRSSQPEASSPVETFTYARDVSARTSARRELVQPPNFMVDIDDPEALDRVVQSMIAPNPVDRPAVEHVRNCLGVQWVGGRRRAGATIYEGNFGPEDGVLNAEGDIDMAEAP